MNTDSSHEYKVTIKDCLLIAYSGIRGAFPLILCLGLVKEHSYDLYFRQTAILITIGTIFMGMIFNGLTLKLLATKLNIVKNNPKIMELKNIIRKEVFVKMYNKFKQLK